MSDCWLIASAALGSAVIGSLSRSRCPWSMDWTSLRVVFACSKVVPIQFAYIKSRIRPWQSNSSFPVRYVSLCGTSRGRSAWLAAGGSNLSAVDRHTIPCSPQEEYKSWLGDRGNGIVVNTVDNHNHYKIIDHQHHHPTIVSGRMIFSSSFVWRLLFHGRSVIEVRRKCRNMGIVVVVWRHPYGILK